MTDESLLPAGIGLFYYLTLAESARLPYTARDGIFAVRWVVPTAQFEQRHLRSRGAGWTLWHEPAAASADGGPATWR